VRALGAPTQRQRQTHHQLPWLPFIHQGVNGGKSSGIILRINVPECRGQT